MTALSDARERIVRYMREQGTEAPGVKVRERLAAAYSEFDDFLAGLDERLVRRAPADGGWSAHDVVDHLIETDRACLDEIRCVVAGERPPGPPIAASVVSPLRAHRPWPWLVREVQGVHADVLDACAPGGDHQPGEAAAAIILVVYGDDTDGQPGEAEWVVDADWRAYAICLRAHTREHLNQIRRSLLRSSGVGVPTSQR